MAAAGHRDGRSAWAFLAFPLAVIFVFTALPTLAGIAMSLFQWSGGGGFAEARFAGAHNYAELLESGVFWAALRNTLIIAVTTVPITVLLAFLLASAMHAEWFRGKTAARTIFFIPVVISIVAIGFIWRWALSPTSSGLLNASLLELGWIDSPIVWLGNNPRGLTMIVLVTIWRSLGFSLVLYLAALGSVPRSLYEAGAIDGAGPWKSMWAITWPGVQPMTWFLLITGMIGALQVFDLVLVMIGTAHQEWTDVLNLFLYREFTRDRLGFAAAIGVVILLVTLAFTLAQVLLLRRREAIA